MWYVDYMDTDYYDDDLPAPKRTWAESFRENKGLYKKAGLIIAVPASLSILSFTIAHIAEKKLESL